MFIYASGYSGIFLPGYFASTSGGGSPKRLGTVRTKGRGGVVIHKPSTPTLAWVAPWGVVWYNMYMENPTNYRSDLNSDDQFIMQDAIEDMMEEDYPEPTDDDCEALDEWLGGDYEGGVFETGDWIGCSDADGGL